MYPQRYMKRYSVSDKTSRNNTSISQNQFSSSQRSRVKNGRVLAQYGINEKTGANANVCSPLSNISESSQLTSSVYDTDDDTDANLDNLESRMCQSPFFDALLNTITSRSPDKDRSRKSLQRTADLILLSESSQEVRESPKITTSSLFGAQHRPAEERSRHPSSSSGRSVRSTIAVSKGSLDDKEFKSSSVISPNVEKLDGNSVVKIAIKGPEECIEVLCARDVLKMRSSFFYNLIIMKCPESTTDTFFRDTQTSLHNTAAAQFTISVEDIAPFECASFLCALHNGKNLLVHGEWSFHWVRLAVHWEVMDIVDEFASLIDSHIESILTRIESNHWRRNPDVLSGFRVAVFRQTNASSPTILTGTILDTPPHIQNGAANALRVKFDGTMGGSDLTTTTPYISRPPVSWDRGDKGFDSTRDDTSISIDVGSFAWSDFSISKAGDQQMPPLSPLRAGSITLDIKEPIWVLPPEENAQWVDPDAHFLANYPKLFTNIEKITFWEMLRAVVELPKLSERRQGRLKSAEDIAISLSLSEYRALWADVPLAALGFIPHIESLMLIHKAYVASTTLQSS